MALTLSRKEIGLIYRLLRNTNDNLLETSQTDTAPADGAEAAFPKSARPNKLIASNLRQKLQTELAMKS
ncbi:MAG: hypothetical protein L0387_43920 [Acidobacteria bacterium]|nr:hypothetical protein [Acidobacteriota bacterium]